MKQSEMFVLIIGIDQHDSPNLPPLQGARNDAIGWYRFCQDHLGVPAKNITVLASPRLGPKELGPRSEESRLRGATRAELVEEARRLAKDAAACAGLVTFAGHGFALGTDSGGPTGSELALCPSDTAVTLPEGGGAVVSGAVRFSELAEIFGSLDCRDNITVVLDTCYSNGPSGPWRAAAAQPGEGDLERVRQVLRVDAFTNRLFLGARHWTAAHEVKVGGQWRGAASYAMSTLMERWALREESGIRYPNVSHADLLGRVRDLLDVLGVPQVPALWGQRRLDEMPVLRPGLRFSPGETSPTPDAATNRRQLPINPDKIGLITILDQNRSPILHVVVTGRALPAGITGVNAGTEYWYTNTTSAPTLTGLSMSMVETTSQRELDAFVSGWTPSIQCAQLIGQANWASWASGTNTGGTLFQTVDPTGNDRYLGLYLEYLTSGTLRSYAWYRITLLTDGFAYDVSAPPGTFTAVTGTDPNSMASGSWKYSRVVSPP